MRNPDLKSQRALHSQRGAATLVMTVVILLLVTMVGIYTGRTVVFESKVSANDFRSRQAFEAAESGLSRAIAYLSDRGGADKDKDGAIDPVFDTDGDGIGDVGNVTFDDNSSATVTITGTFPLFAIQSTGVSDDRTATRTVRTLGATVDALPNPPGNPLTTKGLVDVDGSATIHNPEGNSTIWSGSDVQLGSNNSTATNIANPTDVGYPTCMDTPMTCSTTRSSNKVAVGLDVIEYDTTLGNLTVEEMFKNFFGLSMENYKASRVTLNVAAANVNNLSTDSANPGVDLAVGEVVWVEGDAVIENNTTVGCEVPTNGGAACPIANMDPSIVIINGNLATSGTPSFNGIVYVIGNVDVGSNSTVTGAMIVSGEARNNAGGSLDIWYHSGVLRMTRDNGPLAGAPGSWRDW